MFYYVKINGDYYNVPENVRLGDNISQCYNGKKTILISSNELLSDILNKMKLNYENCKNIEIVE